MLWRDWAARARLDQRRPPRRGQPPWRAPRAGPGLGAVWLRSGLQIRAPQFDSGRGLQFFHVALRLKGVCHLFYTFSVKDRSMRRLAMNFQPVFMSGHSLRRHDKSHWEYKVRPSVVPAQLAMCSICSFVALERRLIHADEVWDFPGPPNVTLIDVRPLCTRCHEAKDFSHLLDLIDYADKQTLRDAEISKHYCEVNGCTEEEFKADFDQALAIKHALEKAYGRNCSPAVDYGRWPRSPDKPRLSESERRLLKKVFDFLDAPIEIPGHIFRTYKSAVPKLQAIPIDKRPAIFAAIESCLDEDDEDFEMFPDHECPWDIKMAKE